MGRGVRIQSIVPLKTSFPAKQDFEFEIIMHSMEKLEKPIQWSIVFMGCSEKEQFEQLLESFDVPIDSTGDMKFNVVANAPDLNKLPTVEDIFDSSALCFIARYDNREFFRCSFLVCHRYKDDQPRDKFTVDDLYRHIYVGEPPRVIVFQGFNWDCADSSLKFLHNSVNESEVRQLQECTNEILRTMGNPFEQNENSMFFQPQAKVQSMGMNTENYSNFLVKDKEAGGFSNNQNSNYGNSFFNGNGGFFSR